VEDLRAFHAEPNAIKADEITAHLLHALNNMLATRPMLRSLAAAFASHLPHLAGGRTQCHRAFMIKRDGLA
jgi:hypothetical protein